MTKLSSRNSATPSTVPVHGTKTPRKVPLNGDAGKGDREGEGEWEGERETEGLGEGEREGEVEGEGEGEGWLARAQRTEGRAESKRSVAVDSHGIIVRSGCEV
eukprot:scaffold177801_cov28-Tisochrysis_lutea.AAC.1